MNRMQIFSVFFVILLGFPACAHASLGKGSVPGDFEEGLACYYSDKLHGNKTANGEIYDKTALTAAHRELPFGTVVRVTNLENRRTVEVRINDRGPFSSRKRIIDLSREAAKRLDMIQSGIVEVRVEIVEGSAK